MTTVYEYWQHRATGEVWAVKLRDGRVIGAAQLGPGDVNDYLLPHLLPYLRYQTYDLEGLEKGRDNFTRIDGRHAA